MSDEVTQLKDSILNICLEAWRFQRTYLKLLSKLDTRDQTRYLSHFKWFMKRIGESLESAGFVLVNLEGQKYDPGMAATAINLDEFKPDEDLVVEQMLEPVILDSKGTVVKTGTVLLQRVLK